MLIDSHTHIFPQDYKQNHESILKTDKTYAELFQNESPPADAEALVKSMAEHNIYKSIILGMGWTDRTLASDINDYLIHSAEAYPDQLIPFCSVNPNWGEHSLYELERCFNQGVKGIGEIHPDTQNLDITSMGHLGEMMKFCEQNKLPIIMHCSEPVGHTYPGKGKTDPAKTMEFIHNFPNNIIICAHFGGGLPFYSLMPEILLAMNNVYFDSAASPYLYESNIYKTVESLVDSKQILFGSDYPVVTHKRSIDHLLESSLDSDSFMDITHNNILDILNK